MVSYGLLGVAGHRRARRPRGVLAIDALGGSLLLGLVVMLPAVASRRGC